MPETKQQDQDAAKESQQGAREPAEKKKGPGIHKRRREKELKPIDHKRRPKKWSNVVSQRTGTIVGKMDTLGALCNLASVWITLETGTNRIRVYTPLSGNPDPTLFSFVNQPKFRKDLDNFVTRFNSPALTQGSSAVVGKAWSSLN